MGVIRDHDQHDVTWSDGIARRRVAYAYSTAIGRFSCSGEKSEKWETTVAIGGRDLEHHRDISK